MAEDKKHGDKNFSNEAKKSFLEIVSTYGKYQEMMDRKSDISEIAETLGGITEAARMLAINEADDWFDAHTVKRNMNELEKLGGQFDKVAIEAKKLDQRMVGLYEDMGHILSRYYKLGEISEDEVKSRLGINEGKAMSGETPIKIDVSKAEKLFKQGKGIYIKTDDRLPMDMADNLFGFTKDIWDASMGMNKGGKTPEQYGFANILKYLAKHGVKKPEFYTLKSGKLDTIWESVNEESPTLNKKTKKFLDAYLQGTKKNSPDHQFALMHILKGALIDANFHSEAKQLDKFFPKAKSSSYSHEMIDIMQSKGVQISNWAKWDGYDIIDAIAYYTQMTIGGQFGEKLKSLKESINERKSAGEHAEDILKDKGARGVEISKVMSKVKARIKAIDNQAGSRKLSDEKYKLQSLLKKLEKQKAFPREKKESVNESEIGCDCSEMNKRTITESILIESSMAELDMIAKEASDFKEFTKEVYKEFPNLPKNKNSLKWLQDIYKTNESINEAGGYDVTVVQYTNGKFKGNYVVYFHTPKAQKTQLAQNSKLKNKRGEPMIGGSISYKDKLQKYLKKNGLAASWVVNESVNEAKTGREVARILDRKYGYSTLSDEYKKVKRLKIVTKADLERILPNTELKSGDISNILHEPGKAGYKESVSEAKFGYKDGTSSYMKNHDNEYQQAEKINKGNEIKFYDALEQMEDKIGHPKFMTWLSNALRGYNVDMYKDPKIKNKGEAEEALFLLSK